MINTNNCAADPTTQHPQRSSPAMNNNSSKGRYSSPRVGKPTVMRSILQHTKMPASRHGWVLLGMPLFLLVLWSVWQTYNPNRALVVYVYQPRAGDIEYTHNVQYFIREGVQPNDGNDYIIITQYDNKTHMPTLPPLPRNARYLVHPNKCFDLGTYGRYSHFVFLNSGVRGPFLPAWARPMGVHWIQVLTSKIKGPVKMVGPTINCGGAFEVEPRPHVQTYTFAVDRKGLSLLLDAGVFSCFDTYQAAVTNGELKAAQVIHNAGYSIDSLMLRYEDVDWRQSGLEGCNGGMQPIQDGLYDGGYVHPLEVMFVKVKAASVASGSPVAWDAEQYDTWSLQRKLPGKRRVAVLQTNRFKAAAPKLLKKLSESGIDCFDEVFYIENSAYDLSPLKEMQDVKGVAWEHFTRYGFVEGRPYRMLC